MNREEVKARTKQFALRVIRLVEALPKSRTAEVTGKQLLRAATSIGANYRAACRARSKAEFVAKLSIVEEESDECSYWLELIVEAGLVKRERVFDLMQEADEIAASSFHLSKRLEVNSLSRILHSASNLNGAPQSEIRNPK